LSKKRIKVSILCIGSSDAIPFTGHPPFNSDTLSFFLNKNFSKGWGISPFNFIKNKKTHFEEH